MDGFFKFLSSKHSCTIVVLTHGVFTDFHFLVLGERRLFCSQLVNLLLCLNWLHKKGVPNVGDLPEVNELFHLCEHVVFSNWLFYKQCILQCVSLPQQPQCLLLSGQSAAKLDVSHGDLMAFLPVGDWVGSSFLYLNTNFHQTWTKLTQLIIQSKFGGSLWVEWRQSLIKKSG